MQLFAGAKKGRAERGVSTNSLVNRLREPAVDAAQEADIYEALAGRVRPDARCSPLPLTHRLAIPLQTDMQSTGRSWGEGGI